MEIIKNKVLQSLPAKKTLQSKLVLVPIAPDRSRNEFGMTLKAQQLIEFLLVVPFMVIILGILTEYAYALNINMTLSEGLKTVTSSIYSKIEPEMSQEQIIKDVKTDFIKYLNDNNVPTLANNIQVGCAISGQTAVFMTSYTYYPSFTLPNIYFHFLPEQFNFFATVAVPKAFLGANNYNKGIDSLGLDKIWSASDFSSVNSFNSSEKGIMKDSLNNIRDHMLFLVHPNPAPASPGRVNPYALVNWDGTLKKLGNDPYIVDTFDGKLYTCSAAICTPNQMFLNYLIKNDYYNIIFVHDNEVPPDLNNLKNFWACDKYGTPITDAYTRDLSKKDTDTVDGILKRTLALVDNNTLSRGNYDNLHVYDSDYNPGITIGGPFYDVKYFGSMIFVYNSGLDGNLTSIAAGGNIPDKDYNFGNKVD